MIRRWLLCLDVDVLVGGGPFDMELRVGALSVLEGDGHVLLRGREGFSGHGRAAKVLRLRVFGSPLRGLLVDDEQPLAGAGEGVDGVGAGGNVEGANLQVCWSYEGGGGVGSGSPDLAEGDDGGADGAAF